ncbi:phosphate signaling complex protein PhoU [Haloplanus ruber]|uniref:Phosphate-specific transport system accessory protein PhoU n=1 Tax=Haloplanus ruber TaxID=869892 RepID=A0ABD6CTF3_9EURY|nr:phosphate signaling complex protein PhoU [Haloplanus ruber]
MPRDEFQQSLANLRAEVLSMGDLVGDRLDRALTALETIDEAAAQDVIEGDDAVDRRYLELEATCIQLFAQQQPVAGDLRFVTASFKILTDLERVADLAVNLAQYTLEADRKRFEQVDLSAIGDLACEMLDDAMTAYRTDDAALCRTVAARDDELDSLCQHASERVVRDLIEREVADGDGWAVEQLLDDVSRLLLIVRDLERVGDHAVNVAARTLYMIESDPELV